MRSTPRALRATSALPRLRTRLLLMLALGSLCCWGISSVVGLGPETGENRKASKPSIMTRSRVTRLQTGSSDDITRFAVVQPARECRLTIEGKRI